MKRLTIALLSGGISTEREVSIKSGEQVFEALDPDRYDVLRYDPRDDIPRLLADADKIDVALIILHGISGEDGAIQGLLDLAKIPYQGSGVLGSALCMSKLASKQLYEYAGIIVPPYAGLARDKTHDASIVAARLGYPLIVKPCQGGSSIGMSLVRAPEELSPAIDKALAADDSLIMEAYISGTEITGGIIGNDSLCALPIVEIVPGDQFAFFEYEAKYNPDATREICPARISETMAKKAQSIAIAAHKALFCRGYSRTDMILANNIIYVLETNTIPGMTANSLFPLAAKAAGIDFPELLDRLIELALEP